MPRHSSWPDGLPPHHHDADGCPRADELFGHRRQDDSLLHQRIDRLARRIEVLEAALKRKRSALRGAVREMVYGRDGDRCRYCGGALTGDSRTVDHVVPVSRGGTNQLANLVTACRRCNRMKGQHLPEEVGMRLRRAPVPAHSQEVEYSSSGTDRSQPGPLRRKTGQSDTSTPTVTPTPAHAQPPASGVPDAP